MRLKLITVGIVCLLVVSGISIYLVQTRFVKATIVSPIPDKKYAKIIVPTPTLTPTPTLLPTSTPSPIPTVTPTPGPIIAPSDLDALFVKYSSQYNINNELLKKIAKCESSFNPNANAHGYGGLFQFSESLWIQTRTLLGLNPDINLRYNAEESIRTAAFMLSQNHLGIWPSCSK